MGDYKAGRFEKAVAWFIIGCILGMLFLFAFSFQLHAATTSTQKKSNAFGAVISDINPNVTLVGSIRDASGHRDADGRLGITLRIHPKYTYAMFDESITFCDNDVIKSAIEQGRLKTTDQAFTYHRAASRLIDGVPCHALVAIDDVGKKAQ